MIIFSRLFLIKKICQIISTHSRAYPKHVKKLISICTLLKIVKVKLIYVSPMRNSFIYATFYLIELIGLSAIFLENLTEKKFMYNDK